MHTHTTPILRILGLLAATQACSSSPADGDAPTTTGTASLTEAVTASSEGDDPADGSATATSADATGSTSGTATGSTSTSSVDESSSGSPAATTGGLGCATIVYVHFDGITLTEGPDDAKVNTTAIADLATELAPYEGSDEDEIFALAASRFADFDVCFTADRPTEGDYAMVIVTPTNPIAPTVFGLAPSDCGNSNPNNIVFAFSESAGTTEVIGMSIARSLAISFGLDGHDDGGADLMSVFSTTDAMLLDECLSFGNVAPQCPHDPCRGGDQNSYQELLSRLGPA